MVQSLSKGVWGMLLIPTGCFSYQDYTDTTIPAVAAFSTLRAFMLRLPDSLTKLYSGPSLMAITEEEV
jgi:hypothetical protein